MKRMGIWIGAGVGIVILLVIVAVLARGGDSDTASVPSDVPARTTPGTATETDSGEIVVPVDPSRPQDPPTTTPNEAPLIPDPPRPKRVPRWQPPATPPPPAPSAYRVHVVAGSWSDRARVNACAKALARYVLAADGPARTALGARLGPCVTDPEVLAPAQDAGGDSPPGRTTLTSLSLGTDSATGVRTASMYFRRTPRGGALQTGRIVFEVAPDVPRVSLFRIEYF